MRKTEHHTRLWSLSVEDAGEHVFDLYFADVAASFDVRWAEGLALSQETCRRLAALIDARCSSRDTRTQSRILLARANSKPRLAYARQASAWCGPT